MSGKKSPYPPEYEIKKEPLKSAEEINAELRAAFKELFSFEIMRDLAIATALVGGGVFAYSEGFKYQQAINAQKKAAAEIQLVKTREKVTNIAEGISQNEPQGDADNTGTEEEKDAIPSSLPVARSSSSRGHQAMQPL